jgi:hypothetical protein
MARYLDEPVGINMDEPSYTAIRGTASQTAYGSIVQAVSLKLTYSTKRPLLTTVKGARRTNEMGQIRVTLAVACPNWFVP